MVIIDQEEKNYYARRTGKNNLFGCHLRFKEKFPKDIKTCFCQAQHIFCLLKQFLLHKRKKGEEEQKKALSLGVYIRYNQQKNTWDLNYEEEKIIIIAKITVFSLF